MRRTRNPVYGSPVSRVRIPPAPPANNPKHLICLGFCFSALPFDPLGPLSVDRSMGGAPNPFRCRLAHRMSPATGSNWTVFGGAPSGQLERGCVCRSGKSWADSRFPITGRGFRRCLARQACPMTAQPTRAWGLPPSGRMDPYSPKWETSAVMEARGWGALRPALAQSSMIRKERPSGRSCETAAAAVERKCCRDKPNGVGQFQGSSRLSLSPHGAPCVPVGNTEEPDGAGRAADNSLRTRAEPFDAAPGSAVAGCSAAPAAAIRLDRIPAQSVPICRARRCSSPRSTSGAEIAYP